MRSLESLQHMPAGQTISSDEIVELHSARLLLLIALCGTKDRITRLPRIDGLTKLAKLDFFVRYPSFFERIAEELDVPVSPATKTIESKMVRYHYGPWDQRYYQLLPYLEARSLIQINKDEDHNQYRFFLTQKGKELAEILLQAEEFQSLSHNIRQVADVLSGKSGNQLKNLVYKVFEEEVAEKKLGQVIT
jgi:hypothetical protein